MDTVLVEALLAIIYEDVLRHEDLGIVSALDAKPLARALRDRMLGEASHNEERDTGIDRRVRDWVEVIAALADKDPLKWPRDASAPRSPDNPPANTQPTKAQQKKDHDRVQKQMLRRLHSLVGKDAERCRWASAQLAQGLAATRRGREVYNQWMSVSRLGNQDLLYVELICLANGNAGASQWVLGFRTGGSDAEFHRLLLDHLAAQMGVATRQATPISLGIARDACEQMPRLSKGPLADALREVFKAQAQAADERLKDARNEMTQAFEAERTELLRHVHVAEDRARVADAEARELRELVESHARRIDHIAAQRSPSAVYSLRNSVIDLVDTLDRCLAAGISDQPTSVMLHEARNRALGALRDLGVRAGREIGLAPETDFVSAGWYEMIGTTSAARNLAIARRCFYQDETESGARTIVRPGWAEVGQ